MVEVTPPGAPWLSSSPKTLPHQAQAIFSVGMGHQGLSHFVQKSAFEPKTTLQSPTLSLFGQMAAARMISLCPQ